MDREQCARVVSILLAVDIQARVVSAGETFGIEVRNTAHGQRIIWGITDGRWGWTMVKADGSTEASMVPLTAEAEPEVVAAALASTYQLTDLPEDG